MIDINPAKIYLANLSKGSRPTMHSALMIIARILDHQHYNEIDWSKIEYKHTAYIRSQLINKGYAAATINRKVACLRSVLKEAWRLEIISAERYQRASDLEKVKGNSKKLGRVVTIEEQKALARACLADNTLIGIRDYAIINIARLGLRSIEISRLNLEHYHDDSIEIFGKGNQHRVIPVPDWGSSAIDDWLEIRGREAGPLFTQVGIGSKERLCSKGIGARMRKISSKSGVKVTSHCFRYTFVSEALGKGLDVLTVQRAVGHSSPVTTAEYDLRDQDKINEVIRQFEDIAPDA